MYIKKIQLINVWPITDLTVETNFSEEWNPKPLILVWENWSGKTIFLSYIVNFLLSLQQNCWFENTEVEEGKVYKLRSAEYITTWQIYSYWEIFLDDWFWCSEIQFKQKKSSLDEEIKQQLSKYRVFSEIADYEWSWFIFNEKDNAQCLEAYQSTSLLYFPASRFEEPSWLNEDNLNAKASYEDKKRSKLITNRKVIIYENLKNIQNRFLDVVYDELLNRKTEERPITINWTVVIKEVIVDHYSNALYNLFIDILQLIFNQKLEKPSFRIADRRNRKLSLYSWSKESVPNIFNLSTWETVLINLAFSILRDFDLTWKSLKDFKDIIWVVVIDEIDLHLHSNLQKEILPKLLKIFPNIQFIITTHSPLFLLWMEKVFRNNWYDLLDMPSWERIDVERFKELKNAFEYYQKTKTYAELINKEITNINKPILFSEWKNYRYLQKAKEFFWTSIDIEIKNIDELNSNQLTSIFISLYKTKLNKNKVFFVRDCDADSEYKKTKKYEDPNLIPFIFPEKH